MSGYSVLPIFVFDIDILQKLTYRADRCLDYIQQLLTCLNLQTINQTYFLTLEHDNHRLLLPLHGLCKRGSQRQR